MPADARAAVETRRSLGAAALVGAGVMAAVDEIVFHQLLRWHRFYDLSTPAVGVISDGLLHAASLLALVGGFFLLADLLRRGVLSRGCARAGFFVGAGGFQLFDGIVDHKVLRVHQVRYVEDLLPYDVAWNLAGLALLLVGVALWRRARAERAGGALRTPGAAPSL